MRQHGLLVQARTFSSQSMTFQLLPALHGSVLLVPARTFSSVLGLRLVIYTCHLGSAHPHYDWASARLVTGWSAQLAPLVLWGR